MGIFQNRFSLFKQTREMEAKIELFLTNLIHAGDIYQQTLELYLNEGCTEAFRRLKEQVSQLEVSNDALRRDIENQMYIHMILPDMRSDILRLLEGSDKIINKYESNLIDLSIERQRIPKEMHGPIVEMLKTDLVCVSALVTAIRSFLAGTTLKIHTDQVFDAEHQVDLKAIALKEAVFENKRLGLARQLQLKNFVYDIEKISDIAEDVADLLTVMSVKHTI